MSNIIIKNTGLSCHIDSLLIALFYIDSNIRSTLLNNYIDSGKAIYLQEYIKVNIINNIINNKSILEDNIKNLIRLLNIMGWYNDFNHIDKVKELYGFLMKKLDGPLICIEKEYLNDNDKLEDTSKKAYIDINIADITEEVDISVLINRWIYNPNKMDIVNNMTNIPYILGININRLSDNRLNNVPINIIKGISPATYSMLDRKPIWKFHSLICFEGDINKGHFYSLLYDGKNYYIHDNHNVPAIIKIDIKNHAIAEKIKRECTFLIYKYIGYK